MFKRSEYFESIFPGDENNEEELKYISNIHCIIGCSSKVRRTLHLFVLLQLIVERILIRSGLSQLHFVKYIVIPYFPKLPKLVKYNIVLPKYVQEQYIFLGSPNYMYIFFGRALAHHATFLGLTIFLNPISPLQSFLKLDQTGQAPLITDPPPISFKIL